MIYNMKQTNFNALGGINLKLDDIKSVIEFGQLGKGKIVLHSSSKDDTTDRLSKVLNALILDDSVPPTSVQSFLEARPSLTTVVITNHGKKFLNRYYNSILDDGENLGFNRNDSDGRVSAAVCRSADTAGRSRRRNVILLHPKC
ncbi:hypothetical protein DMN91_011926 [Ooceraea biroi]|uniref:Nicastrin n=2 Tax=Ooceraea biroi TaxID=2015173 RepID=A0A3L8D7E6_OOCBI|nr:nicastrin-like [Ooceraea biroi]XP_026829963.1 nicastrin-like [Ooceraea biroi]RLU16166.1 hypothetical protein DMN91_011926 [Ooceraea biroi]